MTENPDPMRLASDDAEAAADLLARAFQDDAGTAFFLPDPAARAAALPAFFHPMVRFALASGEAFALGDPLAAVALWLPPGVAATGEALAAHDFGEVVAAWPPEVLDRFGAFVGHLGAEHQCLMAASQRHWTLFFLGVAPERQGQGLGSALLRPMLERIRAEGLPCYTETLEARNLPFYQRLGFDIVAESVVPGSTARVWSLRAA